MSSDVKYVHRFCIFRSTFEHARMDCNGLFTMFRRRSGVVAVYGVLREQNADVCSFSRLQCIWKLTDEWANFMLAYETELH